MTNENLPTTEDGADTGMADECECTEPTKDDTNPEISEDIALICIAEGRNAAVPLTKEQLERSYFRKAFEKLKGGKQKCCWNWTAGCFETVWFLYHKMYLELVIFTAIEFLGFCVMGFVSVFHEYLPLKYFDVVHPLVPFLTIALFLAPHVLLGMFGNYWLLKSAKRRVEKGYHLCPKYNGLNTGCMICAGIGTLCFFIIGIASGYITAGDNSGFGFKSPTIVMLVLYSVTWFPIIFVVIRDRVNIQKTKKKAMISGTPDSR
ncbi:MAG: DUF2628 domain-containing protein [Holosporales bacterium]|jgi:uncharacterized protein with PQ loop repeat|nr:DUF2628 domain-containing protein [Holosporales bacterium]